LFPREDLFLSSQEINLEEHFFQTAFPHGQIDQILGLRRHQPPNFRSRLSLMLDAFGSNKRQARYEADLICCWASMCNIKYDYDKRDNRAVALQKVLAALRRDGVKIFNFLVNTEARLEVDLQFIEYASVHRLCNTTNKAFLLNAPIFSGQTDTVFHLLHSVMQSGEMTPLRGNPVELRPVRSRSTVFVDLDDRQDVAQEFGRIIQGARSDGTGFVYTDILAKILEALEGLSSSQLKNYVLVVVDVPVMTMTPWKNGPPVGQRHVAAWAICPRSVRASSLEVAREGLNGTLVLVEDKRAPKAVAYLTVTHAQCGTYLLAADDTGEIKIDFEPPQRSDIMMTMGGDIFGRELMHVRVAFE
jgi:hypothetical protein